MCWGSACHSVLNPIRVLQNKVVKAMLFKPIDTRIQPLLAQINILRIKDVFNIEIAKHVHKFQTNSLPNVFKEQYTNISNTHNTQTRSSTRNDLVIHRTKKDIGKRSSSVLGATVWNSIPSAIRTLKFNKYKASLLASYSL